MRALLALAIIAVALSSGMAPKVQPLGADLDWSESRVPRPWLDPTCYDDDHTAYGITTGWLAAGQSWSFTSPRVVCSAKIQRGYVTYHHRLDADVALVDYGQHPVTGDRRVARRGPLVTDAICNTDLGVLHVELDPTGSEPGEPASAATWTVTARRSGEYTVELILDEPWWQGRESSPDWCLDD